MLTMGYNLIKACVLVSTLGLTVTYSNGQQTDAEAMKECKAYFQQDLIQDAWQKMTADACEKKMTPEAGSAAMQKCYFKIAEDAKMGDYTKITKKCFEETPVKDPCNDKKENKLRGICFWDWWDVAENKKSVINLWKERKEDVKKFFADSLKCYQAEVAAYKAA